MPCTLKMKSNFTFLCLIVVITACQQDPIVPNQTVVCSTSFEGFYICQRDYYNQTGSTIVDTTYVDTLEVVHNDSMITAYYWTFHQDSVCQEQTYLEEGYQYQKSVRFWGDSIDLYSWSAGLGGQGSSHFIGKKM